MCMYTHFQQESCRFCGERGFLKMCIHDFVHMFRVPAVQMSAKSYLPTLAAVIQIEQWQCEPQGIWFGLVLFNDTWSQ